MLLERPKARRIFICKTNNYFTVIKRHLQVFEIAKFEFKVTLWPMGKVPSCNPSGQTYSHDHSIFI